MDPSNYEAEVLQQLKTIKDWIRFAASEFERAELFYGHGTDNAWDEAVTLVLHVVNLPHELSRTISTCRLTLAERKKIVDLIHLRVSTRKPLPYLTHCAWFAGLAFYIDERALIPRSPLGEIIQNGFSLPWLQNVALHRVLDLCCGSGCIAIATAHYFSDIDVWAADIDADALEVAKMNVQKFGVEKNVTLIQSDLFSNLKNEKFDLILCNPPYVDAEEINNLPKEFLHEPRHALASGEDGLNCARIILQQAANYLTEDGVLILEVGASQFALQSAYPQVPFIWLDFQHGGEGVCLITHEELKQYF